MASGSAWGPGLSKVTAALGSFKHSPDSNHYIGLRLDIHLGEDNEARGFGVVYEGKCVISIGLG